MVPSSFFFVGERLAIDLLNTVIAREGRAQDLLAAPGDVAAWAAAAGVVRRGDFGPDTGELKREPERLRAFREALRRGLIRWTRTRRPSSQLVALVNRHLAGGPEVVEVTVRRGRAFARRRPTGTARQRLYAAVARSAAELLESGAPRRLRKCANPSCRLMFYDVSKAGRRRWCSMQTCGARAKVAALRARSRRGVDRQLPSGP